MKFCPLVLGCLFCVLPAMAAPVIIYDNTFTELPPNILSIGFQDNGISAFGDLVQFAAVPNRNLTSATVILSNWAYASEWGSGAAGYLQALTLDIYNVDSSSGTPQPGTLIASVTKTTLIPWRPEPSGGCSENRWLAGDSQCYRGIPVLVQFDFNTPLLPNQIIYGVSFNTQNYGAAPYGVPGPYDELKIGVTDTSPPLVGSRPLPDTAYMSAVAGFYTDGGAAGTGFRQDTNWAPYSTTALFFAETPEPGTAGMFFGAVIFVAIARRLRSSMR